MSVNKATVLGNLTADPVLKAFDNGGKVATFTVATNERAFKTADGKEILERTEYHNIVVRNKLSEVAEKYLRKGNKLYLEGIMRTRKYTGNDGANHYITEIHAHSFEMLTAKNSDQQPTTHTDDSQY
jgi:single-strand DNA-binding protein